MIVTSTPSIEGKQIQAYLGIVMGSTVRARHLGTDILATLKNIVFSPFEASSAPDLPLSIRSFQKQPLLYGLGDIELPHHQFPMRLLHLAFVF